MAAITVTYSQRCAPAGGLLTITNYASPLIGRFRYDLVNQNTGQALGGVLPRPPQLPYTIGPLADGVYELVVTELDSGTQSEVYTLPIACGPPPSVLQLVSLTPTSQSAGAPGSLTVVASGGTGPYVVLVVQSGHSLPGQPGQPVTFTPLPPGTYTVRVTDSSAPQTQQVSGTVTIAPYVVPVVGCMDEEATNYNPEATAPGACTFAPRWRSAWQAVEVVAVAPLPTAAYLEAELSVGFPAGHPLAPGRPLTLLTTVRATVSPGGLATFRLGPFLRPELGAPDGHGGRRLDLNSPGAYTDELFVGYDLRLADGTLLQRGLVLNSAVPDAQLRTAPGDLLTPFAGRLPAWPGFADYRVCYIDLEAGRYGFLGAAPLSDLTDAVLLPCPKNPLPVAWLAPGGGFGYWVFAGRPRHGLDQEEGTLYHEAGTGERRFSQRGQALATITASSGVFSGADWALGLQTLRRATQVWYQPEPGGPWVPVVLESGSFSVHRKGVRKNEVVVTFSAALALPAQGQ